MQHSTQNAVCCGGGRTKSSQIQYANNGTFWYANTAHLLTR